MTKEDKIDTLARSMKQTVEWGNLSVIGDLGEVALDAALDEGVLREIPIIGTIVGAYKCIRNANDMLFTRKLLTFLWGIRDVDPKEREEAIAKWEKDSKYRINVGETLLNMINRCDDSLKAQWLSKLFYQLVLKEGHGDLFMRAEKALSVLSVMDVMQFIELPKEKYLQLSIDEAEPFFASGLYVSKFGGLVVDDEGCASIKENEMHITEVGFCIYRILNDKG